MKPNANNNSNSTAALSRGGSDIDDIITLLHGSDPVRVELNRLENELRGINSSEGYLFIITEKFCFLGKMLCFVFSIEN